MTGAARAHKHLVLLGAGHAHVHVLSTLAAHPFAGVQVTLISPYRRQLDCAMVPGYVAGHYALADCVIPLEPLLKHTGVRWLSTSASALDADAGTLTLDDGSTLEFDWLSVNTGAVQDRQQLEQAMPGAREHGLCVRPIETFAALWPQVLELASTRTLRVAVIGAGAAGIELAMAIQHRLPAGSVTLISGTAGVANAYPPAVQNKVMHALKRRRITVLPDLAVGIEAGQVRLASGARLACDVPLIATGAQAPGWLRRSGLALSEDGLIAVDACQRCTRHPHVFAAGGVSARVEQSSARKGVHAVRAGPDLLKNLTAAIAGTPPAPHRPRTSSLNLLSCGDRVAIASWRHYAAQGHWVWWLKNRIDRSLIRRYLRA